MLNQRAQHLLKFLVEHHITNGQPVGSRALSKFSGLELSPASIRNVMADLEDQGYIASPHTSAGRVPTPRGYRLFVDTLLTVQPLHQLDRNQLENNLKPDDPRHVVAAASQLLSDLTHFAGVVMVPRRAEACFKHVEFMALSEKRVVLIIVSADGDVQNRIIVTEKNFTSSQLTEAANFINLHYAGREFDALRGHVRAELSQLHEDISTLMSAVVRARGTESGAAEVLVSGGKNLLDVGDLNTNMVSLRKLFNVFDQKTQLLDLLDISHQAEGVKIFIGGESSLVPLDECSVVTAPYIVDGRIVGTLGVIGPTRMAYERVIPIVDVTARLVSAALSDG